MPYIMRLSITRSMRDLMGDESSPLAVDASNNFKAIIGLKKPHKPPVTNLRPVHKKI